jgi:hypothetical protein
MVNCEFSRKDKVIIHEQDVLSAKGNVVDIKLEYQDTKRRSLGKAIANRYGRT